jgi:tRNA (uracil-5-)-methyltransferase
VGFAKGHEIGGILLHRRGIGKQLEAERKPAPVVHAKTVAAVSKKEKQQGEVKEHKALQIETRPGSYQQELDAKVDALQKLLIGCSDMPLPATQVFASPPENFRMRVEFDIAQTNGSPDYAMHVGKDLVTVHSYPMCCKLISEELMPTVLRALREELLLRERLFQINFHATLHGDAVVSLLYRTPMDRTGRRQRMLAQAEAREAAGKADDTKLTEEWRSAAERLSRTLNGASIIGRTRGNKQVIGRAWVEEELMVSGIPKPLKYRQLESFFSQSNATVCQHMLSWARAVSFADDAVLGTLGSPRNDDLLELYCGNGNFCVALAPLFRKVFATEMVKELLDTARQNAEANNIANLSVGRVSAEELALAMEGVRKFTRLEHVDLSSYDFKTVLVDPPRAGLGPDVATSLARFPRIVYVSCNPESLRDDLKVLSKTHAIRRLAAFDQFPYTDHLEMGILLVRHECQEQSEGSKIVAERTGKM